MRDLKFEGLSADGMRLVLVGRDGQRWSVLIDERVEAAVRRDRARLAQVEIERDGTLRPKEIQARIRAGASPEDVATASGLPIERVLRYVGPVLTERDWMAGRARLVELRRPDGPAALGDVVGEHLTTAGVDPKQVTWDSWRRDDGTWVVIAAFGIGANQHVATWTYDPKTQSVSPQDDNAEQLMAPGAPTLRLVVDTRARRTLSAVSQLPADRSDESDADDGAEEPASGPSLHSVADLAEVADSQDELEDEGGPAHLVTGEPARGDTGPADTGPADTGPASTSSAVTAAAGPGGAAPTLTQAQAEGAEPGVAGQDTEPQDTEPHDTERQGVELRDTGSPDAGPQETGPQETGPQASGGTEPPAEEASEALFPADPAGPAKPKPSGGRSAIPSFDDILFGPKR